MADLIQWGISLKSQDAIRKLNDLQVKTQTTGRGFTAVSTIGKREMKRLGEYTADLSAQIGGANSQIVQMAKVFGPVGIAAGAAVGVVTYALTKWYDRVKKLREEHDKLLQSAIDYVNTIGRTEVSKLRQHEAIVWKDIGELQQKLDNQYMGNAKMRQEWQTRLNHLMFVAGELAADIAEKEREITRAQEGRSQSTRATNSSIQEQTDSNQRMIDQLQFAIDTFGMTKAEVDKYRFSLTDATDAQKELYNSLRDIRALQEDEQLQQTLIDIFWHTSAAVEDAEETVEDFRDTMTTVAQHTEEVWLNALSSIQSAIRNTFGEGTLGRVLGLLAGGAEIYFNTKQTINAGKGQQ